MYNKRNFKKSHVVVSVSRFINLPLYLEYIQNTLENTHKILKRRKRKDKVNFK